MRTFAQNPKAPQQTASPKFTIPGQAHSRQSREVNSLLHLQVTIENQAVLRRLKANSEDVKEGSTTSGTARLGHDFSRIAIHAPVAPATQTKPAIHKPGGEYQEEADSVREVAERGISGSGGPLPHSEAIQRSFGRHDVSSIRAHVGGPAAGASRAIGATAYTIGNEVAFIRAPDLNTAAHEAAHVVQQRAGVNLLRGVGQQGDPYEQHADAVAARVVEGRSAEHLLDRHTGSGGPAVQRFAFLNETQIEKSDKNFTPKMKDFVTDTIPRNYTSVDEFKKHAGKQTDYLGNLADGTWMRFSPTGINLLGENHTKVTLDKVVPAVGSKSFIDERFTSDVLKPGSGFQKAYEVRTRNGSRSSASRKRKTSSSSAPSRCFPRWASRSTSRFPTSRARSR